MQPDQVAGDNELWHLISQENDAMAFEQLYKKYMHVLMSVLCKWTDDRTGAEDVLQEVFLDLWDKRGRINIQQGIFPYLYSMTRYKIFDRLREQQLKDKHLQAWSSLTSQMEQPVTAFLEAELKDREALVSSELAKLPAQMKKIYLLSAEQGKNIREISEELLVSPYTVKNHLHKIRKRLRSAALRLSSFF
jgi:RNA polymerase sigma-70 factor (ECF subfamily)